MAPDLEAPRQDRHGELFEDLPLHPAQPPKAAPRVGKARVVMPDRSQMELRAMELESLLPAGHHARLVWAWVQQQDLSAMYAAIKVQEGGVGRSALAPELLLALWLYATLQGVGSARQLSALVMQHDAYRWISGGVQVNHHSLSDFRVAHDVAFDELLSTSLAALVSAGAVRLERVAQDGMRVRASAGAASFRRRGSLQDNLEAARERVRELKAQLDADPGQYSRRQAAAQQRARQEMQQRLQAALDRLPELEAIKRRNGEKANKARASSTDAQASVMKMADGGFRPAYNLQLASDCDSQVIVGVDVSTSGSDMAQLQPMVEQVEQRLGHTPGQWLVDGGFPAHEQLDAVADKTEVLAPVPEPRPKKDEHGREVLPDKHEPKDDDSAAVAAWRVRMSTPEAREVYKLRAATAECVNAQARNRGLQRLGVRGLPKVRCIALLYALAHNLMRTLALAPQLLGLGQGASAAALGAV
ncbi:IS1182 family transposase [Azohydromonas australica]|uniref:IS1182 family transposase n=1 Tax=Azohydromonas australica TaxID=364039 RepID=UPI0004228F83